MSTTRRAPSGALHGWDWRWARRGALLLAPLAALVALLHATVVLREAPVTALVHYALGGAYGALLGLALGGLVSLLRPQRSRTVVRHPHRAGWVAHVQPRRPAPARPRRAEQLTTTAA